MDPPNELPGYAREPILAAVDLAPAGRLGKPDKSGFSPFRDDISTTRETVFAKIRRRVLDTVLVAEHHGVG